MLNLVIDLPSTNEIPEQDIVEEIVTTQGEENVSDEKDSHQEKDANLTSGPNVCSYVGSWFQKIPNQESFDSGLHYFLS